MALSQTSSSQMTCGPIGPQPMIWDFEPPRARSMAQQPSRELASTDPTTRTQDAGLQEPGSAQRFLSTYAATYNTFNVQRYLIPARTPPSLSRVGDEHVEN